jgi:putative oxidoreductase
MRGPSLREDVALLLLRLCGLGLALAHGWGKVVRLGSGQGEGFIQGIGAMGFPLPGLFAWAAALAEFAGGICIALGLATRVAAGFAAVTMFVAAFLRHHAHAHWLAALGLWDVPAETLRSWGNPELALVYLAICVALVLTGGGRFALDRLIRRR